jgi:hypothetical protein
MKSLLAFLSLVVALGCCEIQAAIIIVPNDEQLLAGDHAVKNPIHEHSDPDASQTDPHAHNSQETVASIVLPNRQVLTAYESYHGDSWRHEASEHRRDSVYYRVLDYQYPNLTLLDSFEDPYDLHVDSNGHIRNADGVKWAADDVDGRLVNKSFSRNQRDPAVANFSDEHFVIAWQSNHLKVGYRSSYKYGVYYNIYSTDDPVTPIVHELDASVEPSDNSEDPTADAFTNLFPAVQRLENNSFLIAWRHKQFDNMNDLNTVATSVRGKVVQLDPGTNIVTESQIFDISEQGHAPEGYDYETGMIAISEYDSTNRKVGIVWLGEDYTSIHGQFYEYTGDSQAEGAAPVLSATNNNFTLDTANSDNYTKLIDPEIKTIGTENYLVKFGAGDSLTDGGQTLAKKTYAHTINSDNQQLLSSKIINASADPDYTHSVQSDVSILGNGTIITCYSLYDENDPHVVSSTSDIYCAALDENLDTVEEFMVNSNRRSPDYKQSHPHITPLGDDQFVVFWESLDANEAVTHELGDDTPSSDDDLFYRVYRVVPEPSTLALLGFGLLGVGSAGRKIRSPSKLLQAPGCGRACGS